MTIYNIQILGPGGWHTGFCGRMRCSLGDMLSALVTAMPGRKLRVFMQPSSTIKIAVY